MTEHVKVAEATKEELFEFARTVLQIEVDLRSTEDSLRNKIKTAGWKKETIPSLVRAAPTIDTIDNARPLPLKVETVRINDITNRSAGTRERKYYAIRIETHDGPGGREPVPVAVNGRAIYIPRGKPVGIAEEYVEALEHAQQKIWKQNEDVGPHNPGGLQESTLVPSYPFSFVSNSQVKPEDIMNFKAA